MIRRSLIIAGALFSASVASEGLTWFESNTPLTQTHKHLLNNDLPAMFSSLVEVWQLEENVNLAPHLNDLLIQSLEVDCGKGLGNKAFPSWLKGVLVQRSEIQSPGRDAFRATVEVQSTLPISRVSLTRWVDKSVSNDNSLERIRENQAGIITYSKRYNISNKLAMGLYRIDIVSENNESWSSWLILGDPKLYMTVRWASKDHWQVEQNALLNPNCPLPKLNAALYDYVDGKYNQVWTGSYESDYPTSLPLNEIDAGRYVLAVSMAHRRWQGQIIVEQAQIISKTYDVSVEE
ncbi:DUF2861 family protein [Vibrio panuliri]|uniref:DUF2861 domain-containing protein n=1 Tax=Vibrio panuliri TaxID=1381081 RepID=A0A1Q9H9U1_9VIBR|nr:DUF2861 family protein [Vibrio panuliri]KAB1457417.1 DUF2861 family protein [Vibrio panuliri]OLQ85863.1 hypothetical protein BIY22_13335 [Vibrio panuliri]OLQ91422.1 hypothetical protein BIY20_01020 [Vibrio panuliri]